MAQLLPKRSHGFLIKTDAHFFRADERQVVDEFVARVGKLQTPSFEENSEINELWKKHFELRTKSRAEAPKIRRALFAHLKAAKAEWVGYALERPEPNMISFEKRAAAYVMSIGWDVGRFEMSCSINVRDANHETLVSNYTLLGGLGISSSPAWYADEESALDVATVCAGHAFKVSNKITACLDELSESGGPRKVT